MITNMHIFQFFLLDRADFVSVMSLVTFLDDFEQSLLNTKNSKFLRDNIYLPSMRFLHRLLRHIFIYIKTVAKYLEKNIIRD